MKSQNPASEPPQKIKVLIVDDHPMFREQLAQLINREFGLEVCGEADNVQDAMILLKKLNPAVAIVDITLKGSSGLELLKDIKSPITMANTRLGRFIMLTS